MDKDTLKMLGITRKDILDRLVDKLAEELLSESHEDNGGGLAIAVEKELQKRMSDAVSSALANITAPTIAEAIKTFKLTETNTWGEPKKEPKTFTEYLMDHAKEFLAQPVKYNGETDTGYSSDKKHTRLVFLAKQSVEKEVLEAVKKMFLEAHQTINAGLMAAIRSEMSNLLIKVEKK